MSQAVRAKDGFTFYTRLHLTELLGLKAANLSELLALIKTVPGSCIYHHTHRFLQQHQYLSPEPPNDFAYWVVHFIGEDVLGEQLASIDIVQFSTIRDLREKILEVIQSYVTAYPQAQSRVVHPGEEFHFMKSMSFILPTPYVVHDLVSFLDALRKVTFDSVYFHIFESRLRLERGANDFSYWLEHALGEKTLAAEIARLDPYTHTLEDLRQTIIKLVEKSLRRSDESH